MRAIRELVKVMPPPPHPLETPTSNSEWRDVEARFGMALPKDYKDFISTYGTGAVDGFIWVLNPFSRNHYVELFKQISVRLDALRSLDNEVIPYPLFPEVNGICPWGFTDNGDVLYWHCCGRPAKWPIVVNESRGPRWRKYDLRTTEFLRAVVTRSLICDVFPDDFPSDSPVFVAKC